jgi:hypothetical protein
MGEWVYISMYSLPQHYIEVSGLLHAQAVTPGERILSTYSTGGWMGPRASLDAVEKRKISYPCQELNSSSSAIQPAAHCYTD